MIYYGDANSIFEMEIRDAGGQGDPQNKVADATIAQAWAIMALAAAVHELAEKLPDR